MNKDKEIFAVGRALDAQQDEPKKVGEIKLEGGFDEPKSYADVLFRSGVHLGDDWTFFKGQMVAEVVLWLANRIGGHLTEHGEFTPTTLEEIEAQKVVDMFKLGSVVQSQADEITRNLKRHKSPTENFAQPPVALDVSPLTEGLEKLSALFTRLDKPTITKSKFWRSSTFQDLINYCAERRKPGESQYTEYNSTESETAKLIEALDIIRHEGLEHLVDKKVEEIARERGAGDDAEKDAQSVDRVALIVQRDSTWNDTLALAFPDLHELGKYEVLSPVEACEILKDYFNDPEKYRESNKAENEPQSVDRESLTDSTICTCGGGYKSSDGHVLGCEVVERIVKLPEIPKPSPGFMNFVGDPASPSEYEPDADYLNAQKDLENSRPQIEKAASEFIKKTQLRFFKSRVTVPLFTDFAMQEIAEFCGFESTEPTTFDNQIEALEQGTPLDELRKADRGLAIRAAFEQKVAVNRERIEEIRNVIFYVAETPEEIQTAQARFKLALEVAEHYSRALELVDEVLQGAK